MKRFIILLSVLCLCACEGDNDELSLSRQGDEAFARREYAKAVSIWSNAHHKDPNNIQLLQKLGHVYVKMGKIDRAKHFLNKAIDTSPGDVNIQLQLARLNVMTLDFSQAEAIINTLDGQGVEDPELSILKADLYLMKNQVDIAEMHYRKAVIESKDTIRALLKLAIFLKSENRDKESKEIFDIVKAGTINEPRVLLLLADYYLLNGKTDFAEESILQAIHMEPEEIGLQYYLLNFYIAAEQYIKAERLIETMLDIQDDVYLWMTLADIFLTGNRFKEATSLLDKLNERIKDKMPELELLKGKYWLYSGKPAFATSHFKTALSLKPGLTNTRYFLGLTHLINRKVKLSENSLLQTIQIQPDHHNARLLISQLLYKRKEYKLSQKYLEQYPEDFSGYILKGLNLLGISDYAAARKEFQNAAVLSLNKRHIAHYYIGFSNELQKKYHTALQYYETVLKSYPDLVDVSYRYCMMLIKTGSIQKVKLFMEQKLGSTPPSSEIYYIFSKVAGEMNDIEKQETLLKKAVRLSKINGAAFIELSRLYKKQNRFGKSLAVLQECTRKNPEFEEAWLALGQSYLEGDDIQSSLEIMEEGFSKFKESPIFQSNLAWLYLETGKDVNTALNLAQMAYDRIPDNIAITDTLAWAYFHKGIYSQALWLLNDVEKRAPENRYIKYHLGMIHYHQGDFEKAKRYLEKATHLTGAEHLSDEISGILSRIDENSQLRHKKSEVKQSESLIADPEIDNFNDDIIQPQWKQ